MPAKRPAAHTTALIGLTAAAYVAATYATQWLSYREVQFRVAEMLNLLVFFDPVFAPGVILGCALANVFSPFGLIDVAVGTAATAAACFAISKSKRLFAATLWPTVVNGLLIPLEIILVDHLPMTWLTYLPIAASVAIGEFAVCSVAGFAAFRAILRNEKLAARLRLL